MTFQHGCFGTTGICRDVLLVAMFVLVSGCGSDPTDAPSPAARTSVTPSAGSPASDATPRVAQTSGSGSESNGDFDFAPLGLSSLGDGGDSSTAGGSGSESDEQQMRSVIERLQPLQVLLGRWRGTTRRDYDGFKAVDSHEWIWDLQSDPTRPALVVSSDRSPYLREATLSWDASSQKYVMTATDADGVTRTMHGDFTDPVHEEIGSDDKLHRVYRLQFTQSESSDDGDSGERWQIAIAQQENQRYLLEIEKRRGTAAFRRFDTVSTQREGTSFAISDSDYDEKTCIISEGLGTTEILYKGRSYWVCCSGCKAAFDDDPEKWLAIAAKRDKEKKEKVDGDP